MLSSCTTSKTSYTRQSSYKQEVPEYLLLESRYAADVLYTPYSTEQILDVVTQLLTLSGYTLQPARQENGSTTVKFTGTDAKGSFCLQPIKSIPQKYNYIYRIKIQRYPSTVTQDRAINELADKLSELIGNLPPKE